MYNYFFLVNNSIKVSYEKVLLIVLMMLLVDVVVIKVLQKVL